MAEYIEREALLKKFSDDENQDNKSMGIGEFLFAVIRGIIENQPTADVVEVRHGVWLQTQEPLGVRDVDCVECSACHESWLIDEDTEFDDYKRGWKYCPNCGAKMDGKGEGE